MSESTDKELTVERLRRKASAAKSLLSRYQHQVDWFWRTSQPRTIDDYNSLVRKRDEQEQRFRDAVHAWKESGTSGD